MLPTLLAAVAAAVYLIVAPDGADLPAQLLRVKLFSVQGFGLWNNWWYAGSYVLPYSVLFPALGWLITPQLAGALSGVITAWAFEQFAHDRFGDDAWVGASWFGVADVVEPLSGRLTFALGLACAALTVLSLSRGRGVLSVSFALLTALASPVAALFAALVAVCVAASPDNGNRLRGGCTTLAAVVPVAALNLVFPQSGWQPFAFSTLWPVLISCGLVLVLARFDRGLRLGAVLYAAGCLLAYFVHTALGSNATRLGELCAGPLLALLLWPRRLGKRWPVALLAAAVLPLTYIQVKDAVTDISHGSGPASQAAFYAPLIRYLQTQPGAAQERWRVDVPFTRGHWETYYLAEHFPITRGWERQIDIADDSLFYDGRLTAATYRRWLGRLAVRYVAVPDTAVDYSSVAELRLINTGLPYLKQVRKLSNWTVYRVSGSPPIATGAASVTALEPSAVKLDFHRSGKARVRVRWSPYWRLSGVRGCVSDGAGFVNVSASGAGHAELVMRFTPDRVGSTASRCS